MASLQIEPGQTTATGSGRSPHPDLHPGESYFSARRETFGAGSLVLAIGPLRMRIGGLGTVQAATLRRRFAPFLGDGAQTPHVDLTLRRAPVEAFLRVRQDGRPETYRLESRRAGSRLILWSYEFAGFVDPAARLAEVDLVQESGPLFDRGLENFLRVLTAAFVLHEGGFLLHGSCVVRGGRAHVFFGPSGAGKTTVTLLSPGDVVLSDDLTLIVRGADGAFAAAGIPFGMAHHRVPDTNGSFPIASFNRLVQAEVVRRERLEGARALAEVAGSLPFVMQETGQASLAIETVALALRSAPVFRLEFRKDDSFWSAVEEAARPAAGSGR
jgi:hypothetical protein